MKEYKYKYPNESFSGCDMTASIVFSWEEVIERKNTRDASPPENTPEAPYVPPAPVDPIVKTRHTVYQLGEIQTISYSIHMDKKPVRSIGNVNAKDYVMGQRTIAGSLVFAVFNRHFAKNIMKDQNSLFKDGEAFLVDELPPFNIVISLANEYGLRSKIVIYGIRLLTEGQVMSINDVFTENTYQFMATDIEYLNDEKSYSSSKKGVFLIINDSKSPKDPNMKPNLGLGRALAKYHDPNSSDIENITLSVSTSDATRNNPNGRATFSLYPVQTEGFIEISNSSNKTQRILVNGSNSYPIELKPDLYSSKFTKPNPSKWKCNAKAFTIKAFKDDFAVNKYAPIVEVITDTSMQIYSNEPSHSHIRLCPSNKEEYIYYELKNRRVNITGLEKNKLYKIASCSGPDTTSSPEITIRTLTSFDKPFNDFIRLVECNAGLLLYKELGRYYSIIEKARDIAAATENYQNPTSAIIILKKKFEDELSRLDKNSSDYNDLYIELSHNIYACNELLFLSNKVQNNIIASINKDTPVEIPIMFYDDTYSNNFEFTKDITKAEFYRQYKNSAQSAKSVPSYNFKTIDNHENSFKFIGKSGTNHYVQALREHARSPKLEFYEMTASEKADKIKNDSNKDIISDQMQIKIESILKEEMGSNINNSALNRAFMRKTREIDNPLVLDPNIIVKEEEAIKVKTQIDNLVCDEYNYEYYIAVASRKDLVLNDFIYKKKFSSKDNEIVLDNIDFAILKNEDYAIWIEDKDFNQISNVTTFVASAETIDDRIVLEYELKKIIDEIKISLEPILPTNTFNSLCANIEYDEDTTKVNIISKTLEYLMYKGFGESVLIKSLKAIKHLIGNTVNTDGIISDINLDNFDLSFNSNKEGTIVISSFGKDGEEIKLLKASEFNNINIQDINCDYMLVYVVSKDLIFKSDIIFINKSSRKVEVL